jgi:hypothetical protein
MAADTYELRNTLDRFVRTHVASQQGVVSARLSQDAQGVFISVKVEPGKEADLPTEFEDLRVVRGERAPGYVAAGPLSLR